MAGQIRSGRASLWRPIFHKLDTAEFGKIAVDIGRIFKRNSIFGELLSAQTIEWELEYADPKQLCPDGDCAA